MKYMMWALVGLFLLAGCSQTDMTTSKAQTGAAAQLLNLENYHQENSYAFECNTTGFEPHTFSWDFGDGTTRETLYKGVAHTYFKSGTYTVICTAADDLENATSKMTVTVDVPESATDNSTFFNDWGTTDLLSDIPNDTMNDSPYLTYNSTVPSKAYEYEQSQYDDYQYNEYDDWQYNDADTEPTTNHTDTETNNTGNGTILNATNTTNSTNTSISNSTNTTPPIVSPPNSSNGTNDPIEEEVPDPTPAPDPIPVEKEVSDTTPDPSTIDTTVDTSTNVDVSYGKFKKQLDLKGLKIKV